MVRLGRSSIEAERIDTFIQMILLKYYQNLPERRHAPRFQNQSNYR